MGVELFSFGQWHNAQLLYGVWTAHLESCQCPNVVGEFLRVELFSFSQCPCAQITYEVWTVHFERCQCPNGFVETMRVELFFLGHRLLS
mgnify:CR=1 FL=1